MKLRFVTYAYPPLFYPRSLQISLLARALSPRHDLEVVAADFGRCSDSLSSLCADCRTIRVSQSYVGDIVSRMQGDCIKRWLLLDEMFLHLGAFRDRLDQLLWDDVHLITFGQPMSMHLLGLRYKKRYPNLRWTAHFSDPWNYADYSLHKGLALSLNHYYEGKVYRAADSLIFTSTETMDYALKGNYSIFMKKAHAVPHGYDALLYKTGKTCKIGILRIGYFGVFYGKRQPYSLFSALRLIQRQDENILHNLKIEFYGAGDGTAYTDSIGGLEKYLSFNPGVDFMDSLRLSSQMDGLLVIDAPAQVSPFFPSKLADYIGSGRPIFGITPPGTSARILHELGMPVADPASVEQVARTFHGFIDDLRQRTLQLNEQARLNYRSDHVADVFMNAIA